MPIICLDSWLMVTTKLLEFCGCIMKMMIVCCFCQLVITACNSYLVLSSRLRIWKPACDWLAPLVLLSWRPVAQNSFSSTSSDVSASSNQRKGSLFALWAPKYFKESRSTEHSKAPKVHQMCLLKSHTTLYSPEYTWSGSAQIIRVNNKNVKWPRP